MQTLCWVTWVGMSCLVGPPSLLLTSPPDARCHAISAAAAAVVRAQHSFPRTSVIRCCPRVTHSLVSHWCHMVLPRVYILPLYAHAYQRCFGVPELSLDSGLILLFFSTAKRCSSSQSVPGSGRPVHHHHHRI